jgi:glucose/mannose-6-phosphate isomerase
MSFDESVLDDADRLGRRDEGGLLWALATAGAQVREAVGRAPEAGYERLRSPDPPRSVLVATDTSAAGAARVLARLAGPSAPTVVWNGVELPRWAGPADALLVGSVEGHHPRLAALAAQAAQRGLALAVAAPASSPVAAAAGRAPVAETESGRHPRAGRWSILTPLLIAAHALGVVHAPDEVVLGVAEALDEVAATCRPQGDAFTNPAKALATEFAEMLPVIAGAGPLASVAARLMRDAVQLCAGVPAVAVGLPDGAGVAGSLLRGEALESEDDEFGGLFRDRTEDTATRPRLLTIGDEPDPEQPGPGERLDPDHHVDPTDLAARRAADALHGIATQRGLRSSSVDVPLGPPLVRFAAASAFGDFTATYLALGLGIDPSEPRPGEVSP